MKKNHGRGTVWVIFLMTLAVMIAIAANVFFVSVAKVHMRSGTDLSAYADTANVVQENTKALRGNIYTNSGTIIAEDNRTYNIYCILAKDRLVSDKNQIAYVADKEKTAKALAEILKADESTILGYLSQEGMWQTELGNAGRNLSEATRQRIEDLKLPGIEFTDSIQRVYPLGQFASNLIGFAQSDETGTTVGKMGLELYLDNYLKGTDGYRKYQADKHGYVLPGMKEEVQSAVNGCNVYTTVDQEIQEALEESFAITERDRNADRIWGAVMDVHTGKILAWGQYPTFDPNTLDITDYNNYGTQIPYEPGSTLKTFTWAAAINEGKYNGTDQVYSGPFYYSADKNNNPFRVEYPTPTYPTPIANASNHNWGWIDYDHGLIYSSNVVAATIQTALITPDIHLQYLKDFGFFQPVGSDGLPEQTGVLNFTWPGEKISLSYGQGSTVTMLQMLQAYSAVFSDGTMKKPYYIDSIRDPYDNSIRYQAQTKITGTPITQATAKELQEILYHTVNDDDGTAKYYQIPECKLMGKTGTTQVFLNGSYLSGKTIASFMSAMPAEDPQVLVYYCFEAPYSPNAHFETEAAQNLLRKTAMHLGFAAEESEESVEGEETGDTEASVELKPGNMPNLVNHTLGYASAKLNGIDADVMTLGSGNTVIAQYPAEGDLLDNQEKVFLVTDPSTFVLPDMTGWTRKDVTALWQATQFGFKLSGDGIVTSQNPAAGTTVNKGDQIEVDFSS